MVRHRFLLSLSAFFGIIVVAPALLGRDQGRMLSLKKLFAETASANIMTWPIIAVYFGKVSLIGLISNLFVLPLVPLTMLVGFVIGLIGMFSFWLASVTSVLGELLAELVIICSRYASMAPGVELRVGVAEMTAYYALLLLLLILHVRIAKRKVKFKEESWQDILSGLRSKDRKA